MAWISSRRRLALRCRLSNWCEDVVPLTADDSLSATDGTRCYANSACEREYVGVALHARLETRPTDRTLCQQGQMRAYAYKTTIASRRRLYPQPSGHTGARKMQTHATRDKYISYM